MNRLDSQTRAQVISCLIEGCSIRSTVRMTGVAKKTVMRLLVEVGAICAAYQDYAFRNLTTKRLQLDEMWAWIYCKEKNRTEEIAKAHPRRWRRVALGCGGRRHETRTVLDAWTARYSHGTSIRG